MTGTLTAAPAAQMHCPCKPPCLLPAALPRCQPPLPTHLPSHPTSPPPLPLQLNLRGSAGQSFACFLVNGMVVRLVGEANDYVGKGMAGGDVTIVPPPGERRLTGWMPMSLWVPGV